MARTKARKTETSPQSKAVAPVVAVSADASKSADRSGWKRTAAYSLLTQGRFPRPPQCYMDLFYPLLEYYVYHGAPLLSARRDGAEGDAAENETHEAKKHATVKNTTSPSNTKLNQLEVLRGLVFPHGAHAFFRETRLRIVEGSQPLLTTASPAEAVVHSHGGRKRVREGTEEEEVANGTAPTLPPATEVATTVGDGGRERSSGGGPSGTETEAERLIQLLIHSGHVYLDAFKGDDDFLTAQEMYFIVDHWASLGTSMGFGTAIMSTAHQLQLSIASVVQPCVVALPRIMGPHIDMRLANMSRPPRVRRLGQALQLTPKEVNALTYALLCHSGAVLPMSSAGSLTPSSIAFHAKLTPQELTYFIMDSRSHIKQGLLVSDIKYRTTFMDCKYAMPQEAVAALAGNELSDEQVIKLERTALAEILAKEKRDLAAGASSSSTGAAARVRQSLAERLCDSPAISAMQDALDNGDVGSAIANVMDVMAQLKDHLADGTSREQSTCADSATDQSREGSGEDDDAAESTVTEGESVSSVPTRDPSHVAASSSRALEDVLESVASRHVTTDSGETALTVKKPGLSSADNTHEHSRAQGEAVEDVATEMALKDIDPFRPRAALNEDGSGSGAGAGGDGSGSNHHKMHQPYTTNIEYMDESFKVLANLIKIRSAEGDMKDEDEGFMPKNKVEATLRELKGKVRVSSAIHQSRVRATLQAIEATRVPSSDATAPYAPAPSVFVPRIEQLCRRLKLTELEKQIMLLMIGNVVSHDILVAINGRYVMRDGQRLLTVGYILFVLCEGLQERVTARKAFYQSSALLSNGVVTLSLDGGFQRTRFNTDLMDYYCDIDRKIIDYLMGMETETSEMVPGSRLYHPQVPVANVVLPRQTTELVLSTIEHYSLFETCKRSCGFGVGLGNSNTGLVMLFYGPSGTGKTMLANAVANELKKRILLVNVSQFKSDGKAPEMMRFIFREAKLNDAIIFFDECESLFESRESNPLVTAVLAEFENYDGLIVMATNRAQNMDEAMNRRISLMVEFKLPDHQLRERIWASHIPQQLRCDSDVSIEKLALNFELSGGLIRNAVLAALNHAVAREKSSEPVLRQEDFETGARLQLRGFFLAAQRPQGSSEYYITPRRTMADLVVEKELQHKIEAVANLLKSRNTLFSQWGFSEENWEHQSSLYLFHGPDGTGKSLAAEGIAYECGSTIRLCNLSEVFLAREINLVKVFEEARKLGAIVVFDEAQVLFNHSEQSLQVSQLIQYHAARYPRPVLLLATSGSSDGHASSQLDIPAAKLKFEQELFFPLPTRALREQLWRQVFPDKVPLDDDVDFAKLSELPGSAKLIRAVAFNACCKMALLPMTKRRLTMKIIEDELAEQRLREQRRKPVSGMFA